jgi:N6-L-threonylcarbamoyladenine synthase
MLIDVGRHGDFDVLGTTLDDAAGEAFDKGARLLGLGYPGGAAIDRLAREGDAEAFEFPVARVPGLDFSFSGVKTALLYAVRDLPPSELEQRRADLAAGYQRALVRALVERTRQAAAETGRSRIAVVGGVAANSELRAALTGAAFAPLPLCMDNAAMIASAARYGEAILAPGYLGLDAFAST